MNELHHAFARFLSNLDSDQAHADLCHAIDLADELAEGDSHETGRIRTLVGRYFDEFTLRLSPKYSLTASLDAAEVHHYFKLTHEFEKSDRLDSGRTHRAHEISIRLVKSYLDSLDLTDRYIQTGLYWRVPLEREKGKKEPFLGLSDADRAVLLREIQSDSKKPER